MTGRPELDSRIDPQLQSKFFVAPAEIRRAIYSYLIPKDVHIFIKGEGVRFSPCVQREKDGDPGCDSRREVTPVSFDYDDPVFALRLRSPWAEHWRCGELALRNLKQGDPKDDYIDILTLLVVYKQMFLDVAGIVAEDTILHINTFHALGILIPESRLLKSGQFSAFALVDHILPSLRALSISLRLPFFTFQTLTADSTGSESSSTVDDLIPTWLALPSGLQQLKKLRKLKIWLDHDERRSWSFLDERALISPFLVLSNNRKLDMTLNLPKLHPKYENQYQHFFKPSLPAVVMIHRRYRQRYHGVDTEPLGIRVHHDTDFPVMYELMGFPELEYTLETLEEWERGEWEAGEDPREIFVNFGIQGVPPREESYV